MSLLERQTAPPMPIRWKPEEYHQLGNSGVFANRRVELIEGVIIEMSPVGRRHWVTTNLVAEAMEAVFAGGYFVSVQNPIYLPNSEPDVAVFRGSPRDYADATAPALPELVVEVADTSLDYDRTQKSAVYARAAIAEYWIVDPSAETVEVRRLPDTTQGIYSDERIYHRGETLSPLAMPAATIPVDDLLP